MFSIGQIQEAKALVNPACGAIAVTSSIIEQGENKAEKDDVTGEDRQKRHVQTIIIIYPSQMARTELSNTGPRCYLLPVLSWEVCCFHFTKLTQ